MTDTTVKISTQNKRGEAKPLDAPTFGKCVACGRGRATMPCECVASGPRFHISVEGDVAAGTDWGTV